VSIVRHRQWVGFKTIVIKEVTRIVRIWPQTIVPPAITATLYFVIFGNLIGRRIGDMEGYQYMAYIVPGLVMMSVIQNSYGNIVSSFFGAKFGKHIEELMVSPLPNYVILSGYVTGAITRGLTVGLLVACIAMFFTDVRVYNIWVTLSTALLTAIVFALAGFINAVFARKFDDIAIVPTFILTPLTYLGGVFYSISLLPDFWQDVTRFDPILYMVNAFRYGLLGNSDVPIAISYTIILVFLVSLAFISLQLLKRGVGLRT